jgi:hypothetical protein
MHTMSCSPAELVDFLLTLKLTVPPSRYARLLVQVAAGEAWAVYSTTDRSAPLAVAGLYAWPDREAEAWFLVDTSRAASVMPAVVIALRRVLREQVARHERGILARVTPGNRAGETIARCLGFAHDAGEIWRVAVDRGGERAVRRR